MRRHPLDIHIRGFYPLLEDLRTISILRNITLRQREVLQEFGLEDLVTTFLCQLQSAAGVVNHLHGFQTGKFIKKPPTARVHEQSMPLNLKKLQSGDLLFGTQWSNGMLGEESEPCILGAIEDDVDILVPRFP